MNNVVSVLPCPSEQLWQEIDNVRCSVKLYKELLGEDLFDETIKCLDNVLDVSFATLLKPRGVVYISNVRFIINQILNWLQSLNNPCCKEFIQAHVKALDNARNFMQGK